MCWDGTMWPGSLWKVCLGAAHTGLLSRLRSMMTAMLCSGHHRPNMTAVGSSDEQEPSAGHTWRRAITLVYLCSPRGQRTHSAYSKCALMAAWDPPACSFRALANQLMMRSCYLPGIKSSFVCDLASCVRVQPEGKAVWSLNWPQSNNDVDSQASRKSSEMDGNKSLPSPISAIICVNPRTHENGNFHDIDMLNTPSRAM